MKKNKIKYQKGGEDQVGDLFRSPEIIEAEKKAFQKEYLEYIKSPEYKERLKLGQYEDIYKTIKQRVQSLNPNIDYHEDYWGSFATPEENFMRLAWDADYVTQAHESGHLMGASFDFPKYPYTEKTLSYEDVKKLNLLNKNYQKAISEGKVVYADEKLLFNYIKPGDPINLYDETGDRKYFSGRGQGYWMDDGSGRAFRILEEYEGKKEEGGGYTRGTGPLMHNISASESYSDLVGFRRFASKEFGIKPGETLTLEQVKKIKEKYKNYKSLKINSPNPGSYKTIAMDRMFEKYDDDSIVELWNTVADVGDEIGDDINTTYAKTGGPVKYQSKGGLRKKYTGAMTPRYLYQQWKDTREDDVKDKKEIKKERWYPGKAFVDEFKSYDDIFVTKQEYEDFIGKHGEPPKGLFEPTFTMTSAGGPGIGWRLNVPFIGHLLGLEADIDPTGPGMGILVSPEIMNLPLIRDAIDVFGGEKGKAFREKWSSMPGWLYGGKEVALNTSMWFLGSSVGLHQKEELEEWFKDQGHENIARGLEKTEDYIPHFIGAYNLGAWALDFIPGLRHFAGGYIHVEREAAALVREFAAKGKKITPAQARQRILGKFKTPKKIRKAYTKVGQKIFNNPHALKYLKNIKIPYGRALNHPAIWGSYLVASFTPDLLSMQPKENTPGGPHVSRDEDGNIIPGRNQLDIGPRNLMGVGTPKYDSGGPIKYQTEGGVRDQAQSLKKPPVTATDQQKRAYWLNLYSNRNFVKRILSPELNRGREYMHPKTGLKMTHFMGQMDNLVFPLVVEDVYGVLGVGPGQFHFFQDENGNPDYEKARQYALATKEYIQTDTEDEAMWLAENNYKTDEFKRATGNAEFSLGGFVSEQNITSYQTEGVVKEKEESEFTHEYSEDFVNFLKEQENNITDPNKNYYNWGYYNKKGEDEKRFYPYTSVEGGAKTIGWGHKVKKGEDYNKGLTWKEAEDLLKSDISDQQQRMENRFGTVNPTETHSGGAYPWFTKLSQKDYELLLNYEFQVRNSSVGHVNWETLDRDKTKPNKIQGGSGTYPNLIKAIVDGNYEDILKEYKIKGLDRRNKALLETFIEPQKNTFKYRKNKDFNSMEHLLIQHGVISEEELLKMKEERFKENLKKKRLGGEVNIEKEINKYLSKGDTETVENLIGSQINKPIKYQTEGFIPLTDYIPNITKWENLYNQNDSVNPNVVAALLELEQIMPGSTKDVQISSGYRDEEWNTEIGGQPHSRHLQGMGIDLIGDGAQHLTALLESNEPSIMAWKNKWTSDKHGTPGKGVINEWGGKNPHLHLQFVDALNFEGSKAGHFNYQIPQFTMDTYNTMTTEEEQDYKNIVDGYITGKDTMLSDLLSTKQKTSEETRPIISQKSQNPSFAFMPYQSLVKNYSWNDPEYIMALDKMRRSEKEIKKKIDS